ncbi:phage neck terminator protein [Klebsiella michiganensis]|uniref:phage neck terminator protein n=1 Tax=Klebsiella michiganensis TaxID=1134687 RepID=UPI001D0E11C2
MSDGSTSAGYLAPVGDSPPYDTDLERLISRWIRGVTGLGATLVYPRWTDPQKQIPKNGTTWCAFGITGIQEDFNPAYVQGEENTAQWSHESISLILCFYGPQGLAMATRFRDGLLVSQNNDELNRVGLTFLQYGRILNLPELINNQWVRRYDISVDLRRKIIRQYGIQSLVDAPVQFFGD